MSVRAIARLSVSLLAVAALLPLGTAAANPAPAATDTVHLPLRNTTADRATGAHHLHTSTPFKMVGLTWTGAAPDQIEVRTRTAHGWSNWASVDTLPESKASEALWTGPSHDAEIRATRDRQDVTDQLQFIGINPAPVAASGAPVELQPGMPAVVTRAQWGADESKMTWPPEPTQLKAVTVHHTAGTNDYSCADSAAIVRGIYQYHAVELGWGDIGYHALVDKCGTIFEGRTGGLAGNVIGGHARGFNSNTFGISMIGDYDQVNPSPATINSVAALAGWKLSTAGIPANGQTQLVAGSADNSKFPAGATVTLPTIFGHRDVDKTACPGRYGYQHLGEIRSKAAQDQTMLRR